MKRDQINVFFKNPEDIEEWRCRGQPMNINTILEWAKVWNPPVGKYKKIPQFAVTEKQNTADIRVEFSGTVAILWYTLR